MSKINLPILNLKLHSLVCMISFLVFSSSMAQTNQSPLSVDVITPESVENSKKILLSGTVESKQFSQIGPLEAGRVEVLKFEIGDTVTKGQTLLVLDSQLIKMEILSASAEVKIAEINVKESTRLYTEAQKLSDQKLVAKTLKAERAAMVSRSKTELVKAKALLSLQKERLDRHTLTAPFDGVISQRSIDIGEWITQQTTVLTLVAQNELRLSLAIPQQYFTQLNRNSDVLVTVIPDSNTIKPIQATLSRLVPVSDRITRTFLAQIDIPNNSRLVPGMSARAEISVPETQGVKVILPRSALKVHPDGGSSIFIVEQNRAKRVLVEFTPMDNNHVAIYNQPINQTYILTGIEILQDGMSVKVNNKDKDSIKGELK